MQGGGVSNSITTYAHPTSTKRADPQLAEALTKVPAATQKKLRGQAQDYDQQRYNQTQPVEFEQMKQNNLQATMNTGTALVNQGLNAQANQQQQLNNTWQSQQNAQQNQANTWASFGKLLTSWDK